MGRIDTTMENSNLWSECKATPPSSLNSEARGALERYGNRTKFLTTFRFDNLNVHVAPATLDRCFFGAAPSLVNVDNAFGDGTAEEWLSYMLVGISQQCGARTKLDTFQLRNLARLFRTWHYDLKVTELEVFFSRLIGGHYGRYAYDSVDPQLIMAALWQFRKDRNRYITLHDQEVERARRETAANSPTIMSREQYDEQCIRQPFLKLIEAQRTPPASHFQINEDWSQFRGRQKPLPLLMVCDKKFVKSVKIRGKNDKNKEKCEEK